MRKTQNVLFVTLFALNVIDVFTTLYGISIGARETNPLFQNPSLSLSFTKLIFPLLLYPFWKKSWDLSPKMIRFFLLILLVALVTLYFGIVINNTYVIGRQLI